MTELDLGPFPDEDGHGQALGLDARDALAGFRSQIEIDDPELIYLDGNSLGRLPVVTTDYLANTVHHEWRGRLIRSYNERWWDAPVEIGDSLAPLVGAQQGEVVLSDSTSVNLYKLALAAVRARPGRHRIITDDLNFPTDVYVLGSVAETAGADHTLEVVASDGVHGPVEAIEELLDDDTALVSLSSTAFKSGYTYDLARVTRAAHAAGALVLWDLSHSVGAVAIDLGAANADLAVGCTYKYLNGGPGAPAFLYVRADLQDQLSNPITGWWGHGEPFDFDLTYRPDAGIRRFLVGSMPILSLDGVRSGVDLTARARMDRIRAKSEQLTAFVAELFDTHLAPLGLEWASPTDPERRGSHVSLAHPDAWRITQALIDDAQVIPDFRTPDNIRLGFAPLYNGFVEVHTAVIRLRELVRIGVHESYPTERTGVT